MSTVVTGVLGQLAHQDEEVIGVIRNEANDSVLFIHVPWEVAERVAGLLLPEERVTLTGHLCDHKTYLVVTDAAAPT